MLSPLILPWNLEKKAPYYMSPILVSQNKPKLKMSLREGRNDSNMRRDLTIAQLLYMVEKPMGHWDFQKKKKGKFDDYSPPVDMLHQTGTGM